MQKLYEADKQLRKELEALKQEISIKEVDEQLGKHFDIQSDYQPSQASHNMTGFGRSPDAGGVLKATTKVCKQFLAKGMSELLKRMEENNKNLELKFNKYDKALSMNVDAAKVNRLS